MNRNEFIKTLEANLKGLPSSEKKEILYDYKEYFQIGLKSGKTEAALAKELGNPKNLAKEHQTEYHVKHALKEKSFSNLGRALVAGISLSFFNLVFLLGPILAIMAIYLGIGVVALAFILSPFTIWNSDFFIGIDGNAPKIFVSMTLLSVGILIGLGMIYMGKLFYEFILRYIKFNVGIIKGGK